MTLIADPHVCKPPPTAERTKYAERGVLSLVMFLRSRKDEDRAIYWLGYAIPAGVGFGVWVVLGL